jgi:hypothetical protein
MKRPKHLPRLWCALQGLLPLESCLAAQEAELAWPREEKVPRAGADAQRSSVGTLKQPRPGGKRGSLR